METLFSQGHGNEHQLLQKAISSDYMKKFITVRTTKHWNRLSRELVESLELIQDLFCWTNG